MLTIEVTTNLPEGRQQLKPTDLAIDSQITEEPLLTSETQLAFLVPILQPPDSGHPGLRGRFATTFAVPESTNETGPASGWFPFR